ncbi:hypothetical protein V1504DRAFT_493237 [Lipomyces starkeyi]
MATNAKERQSYERALHFLKANKPEKRLDIRLSYESFHALEVQAQALYGNANHYPYTPTALHSSAAVSLQDYIKDCLRDVLVQHGRQGLFRHLIPVGDTTYMSIADQGGATSKSPDNGLKYTRVGRLADLIFVIDVRLSEGYRSLRADIMLWLNTFHCRTAILLWFNEQRRFRYPRDPNAYSVNDRPADQAWFGTMATAVIEVFKRNPTSGAITTENMCASLLGIFPPDEEEVADIQTAPIRPDTQSLRLVLASGGQDTAVARFQKFIT